MPLTFQGFGFSGFNSSDNSVPHSSSQYLRQSRGDALHCLKGYRKQELVGYFSSNAYHFT